MTPALALSNLDATLSHDHEVAELSLLLPRGQAMRLIETATRQGLTVAQLLRRLVSRALADSSAARDDLSAT